MSTLGNFGAVAGGIMGGMKMREDMDARKAERELRQREADMRQQEHGWKKEEADNQRAEREQFNAFKTTQPSYGAQKPAGNTAEGLMSDEQTVSVGNVGKIDLGTIESNGKAAQQRRIQAMGLKDPRAKQIADEEFKAQYAKDLAIFGDPNKDPVGYSDHAVKVSLAYSQPLTPEEAAKHYALKKKFEQEGTKQALEYANAGRFEEAERWYNKQGGHKVTNVSGVEEKSKAGPMGYRLTGIDANGNQIDLGNTFDNLLAMNYGDEQLKNFMANRKVNQADTKLEIEQQRADSAEKQANAMAFKLMNQGGFGRESGSGGNGSGRYGGNEKELTDNEQQQSAAIQAARTRVARQKITSADENEQNLDALKTANMPDPVMLRKYNGVDPYLADYAAGRKSPSIPYLPAPQYRKVGAEYTMNDGRVVSWDGIQLTLKESKTPEAKPNNSPGLGAKPMRREESKEEIAARVQDKQDAQAALTKSERIARAEKILAAPLYRPLEGLLNRKPGTYPQFMKDAARKELEQLRRGK